jgi:iron complex outermembrane receptor protein
VATRRWLLLTLTLALGSGSALAEEPDDIAPVTPLESPSPEVADELPTVDEPADEEAVEDKYAGVEEIVVTIRKREERVQEVPAAITTLSGAQIEAANIQTVSDLVTLVPNATVKSQGGPISIRGISQSFTSQSPVAAHVNGVFKFDDDAFLGQFYDLQAIDVARGPAGTVYGRNATAGAINLVWRKPHSGYQVFGDATAGSYDRFGFRGGINLPILGADDERLLSRFVFQREIHDGFLDNLEQPLRSRDPENADLWHARGALLSRPIDDLLVELRGYYTENDVNGTISRPAVDEFPTGAIAFGPVVIPFDAYAGAKPIPAGERQVRSRAFEMTDPRTDPATPIDPSVQIWSVDGEATYSLHDLPFVGSFDVTLLGGHDRHHVIQLTEPDGSELVVLDTHRDIENQNSTIEFRLTSQETESYSWMFGFFWFDHDRHLFQNTSIPLGFVESTQDRHSSGWAPFFNLEWMPIEDWLQIFGGFRWNADTIELNLVDNGLPPLLPAGEFQGTEKYEEPTGEIGVRSRFLDHHMLYAKFSRGYKAGDVQLLGDEINRIEPEIVQAFEAGSRNDFFDRRLQANLTGFYYDYTDLQVPQILGLSTVTTNAGKASIWGVELELASSPVDAWSIAMSVSYLNATFGEFCANDAAQFRSTSDPGCPPPTNSLDGQINLAGNYLEDSPEWKISLLTNYDLDMGRFGVLTPVLKFTWSDRYFLRPFNCGDCITPRPQGGGAPSIPADFTDIDLQQAFTRTDIRLQWRSEGGLFWGEFFVENLEDNSIYSRIIVGPQFNGGTPTQFGFQAPRMIGGRIGFDWGGS